MSDTLPDLLEYERWRRERYEDEYPITPEQFLLERERDTKAARLDAIVEYCCVELIGVDENWDDRTRALAAIKAHALEGAPLH